MHWPVFEFDYLPAVEVLEDGAFPKITSRIRRLRGQQMIMWLTVMHPIELPEDPHPKKEK